MTIDCDYVKREREREREDDLGIAASVSEAKYEYPWYCKQTLVTWGAMVDWWLGGSLCWWGCRGLKQTKRFRIHLFVPFVS